jgi:LGFP repeat
MGSVAPNGGIAMARKTNVPCRSNPNATPNQGGVLNPQGRILPFFSAIQKKYNILGGPAGFLGAPTTVETVVPDGVGRFRNFQEGTIYWSPNTGAHEMHGAIRELWVSMGWERSFLGYPVTDELPTPNNVGRFSDFQGGQIAWSPALGAAVSASYLAVHGNNGGFVHPQNAGEGSSPEVRRQLSCSSVISITDDDGPDADEHGHEEKTAVENITNDVPQIVLESTGTADKVRVKLTITAKALDNGDVLVNGKAQLFEGGDAMATQGPDGQSTFTVVVPRGSFLAQSFTVKNEDEGGDFADIDVNLNNSAV